MFGLAYLNLSISSDMNTSEIVWESLWKHLMTCP